MHVIGEETSDRLELIPAQFRWIVTHRPKYACRACEEAVVQAPAPERPIKDGLPTRSNGCPRAGCQIRLASAALSTSPDATSRRDVGVLRGPCGFRAQTTLPSPTRTDSRLRQDRNRRDRGAS